MMRDEMDLMCCKSVGTDLSMLDIDDFITEISQLKKEVALLEAKLRSRGDEGVKREAEDVVCCESSVCVTDGCLDSVWMSRDQSLTPQPLLDSKLSEEKSRHTQDSKLSLTLLCYTESKPTDAQDTTVCESNQGLKDEESTDQTSTESLDSVCNAGEQQQILQTTLKMCSVKLIDCRNLMMKINTEPPEEEDFTDDEDEDYDDDDDDDDFIPSEEKSDSCGKTFGSQRHERKRTEQKLFTCSKISFTTLQEKKFHSEEHREEKKQVHCEQCGKDFVFLSQLKVHMRTHSGKTPFYCTECDKCFSTKYTLGIHKRTHTGEKPYKCPHCEMRFNYKPHLRRHVFIHTNERPYQCSECEKTFRCVGALSKHRETHTEKLYQCLHCDKRFNQKYQLIVHERIHTGEKPYLCSYCGKSFADLSSIKVHLRVHTGEKPYHCNVCEKSFRRSGHLVNHQRTHTGEKPYKCSQCEKTFARPNVLKIHQRIHTGEKPYQCSICGERFAYLDRFRAHQNVQLCSK